MKLTRHLHHLILRCLVLVFLVLPVTAREASDRPNFILLFVDDLGYGDMGFTGHPTTKTPHLDQLAYNGKILTTWYSGCSVCSASRAALMTGRQFPRTGLPGVLGPCEQGGLNLNETTVANQLKSVGYATAIVGKWHLGQRQVYLPGNRGFDYYLGIPYSDDMGDGIASSCPTTTSSSDTTNSKQPVHTTTTDDNKAWPSRSEYEALGFLDTNVKAPSPHKNTHHDYDDPAGHHLPLVAQAHNRTKVVQQPLDFTTLAQKYSKFATTFVEKHQSQPFFLYVPFSHVHCTSPTQPEKQYAGCSFQNSTTRGKFGDALAEADWIVGNIVKTLQELQLEENTLILFTSDNGPWLSRGLSAGSEGLFTGRFAGYYDTGKGSTWEGGIRMPAFGHWKGTIAPYSRSSEIISSLDVFPTLSKLAGVPLPTNRVIDGKDMSDILLQEAGTSRHDFLFFYGTCTGQPYWHVAAVRHGKYKAHWCTAPGLGGKDQNKVYHPYPLLFDVEKDPSEAQPISTGEMPSNPEHRDAMKRIMKAYAMEVSTFQYGKVIPQPDGPGEGPGTYGVCCDRNKDCNCLDATEDFLGGLFNVGTVDHHDRYHEVLGEKEPSPPQTRAQVVLQKVKAKRS